MKNAMIGLYGALAASLLIWTIIVWFFFYMGWLT